jgi:hypothetical protein
MCVRVIIITSVSVCCMRSLTFFFELVHSYKCCTLSTVLTFDVCPKSTMRTSPCRFSKMFPGFKSLEKNFTIQKLIAAIVFICLARLPLAIISLVPMNTATVMNDFQSIQHLLQIGPDLRFGFISCVILRGGDNCNAH